MYDVSVIITTYNAEDTVNRAVSSLLHKPFMDRIEIIIVDDCSKDNTPQIIQKLAAQHDNIQAVLLDKNTGSPSEPRNIGMSKASGEYITFLDDDDTSNIAGLMKMYDFAKKNECEFVKGYLKVVNNGETKTADRLYDTEQLSNKELIEEFIAKQSTRIDFLLLNSFQKQYDIRFNHKLKLGEDTVFYTEIFKHEPKVGYCDAFTQYHYKTINISNLSSTQNYQDKELSDHLQVWELAERNMHEIGSSYFSLRLSTAVRNTLMSIVSFSKGMISESVFHEFSLFLNNNKSYLKSLYLTSRYQELYKTILSGDFSAFQKQSKKRILIAGYDLKFILPVITYLEKNYVVLVDEWTGHNIHDEKKSKELLDQADIIWCEWLLGNAVWYSKHKYKHQKLVIRAHRFEITREFGHQVDYSNVNKVFAVGYYYLEEFQRKFYIPRGKMQILSNYVESDIYTGEKSSNYKYSIGLVGSVPKLKGFYRALEILKILHDKDSRFHLQVVGKKADEFPWVMNNPVEKEYFDMCDKFIANNNLFDCVNYVGFVPREQVFKNIGYVLSLSDLESFHLAIAEGYCDNSAGFVLPWDGAEYIYPAEIIFHSTEEIADEIYNLSKDDVKYNTLVTNTKKLIIDNYDVTVFYDKLVHTLEAL